MNRYLSAISYNLAFFLLSSLSFLVLTPLAIHIMGEEFFGLWTLLFAIAQFTNIGSLGISQIVNKLSSEKEFADTETSHILSSALVVIIPMAIISTGILCLIVPTLVRSLNPSSEYILPLRDALYIGAAGILPAFLNKIYQGFFLSRLKNRFVRSTEFITSIFPWLGGVLIASYDKNLAWLSLWNTSIQFFVLFLLLGSTMKEITLKWSPDKNHLTRILHYSKFLFIEWSAGAIFQLVDRIVVGITLGPASAGIYTVATSIGLRLPMVSGYAAEIMIPYASRKDQLGEKAILYDSFRKISGYVSLIIAGPASLCILWIREILQFWISPHYADTNYLTFTLVILGYGYISLAKPAHQTLTGLGRVRFTSLTYLIASSLMILGLFFLSKSFGLPGAGSANLIMTILLVMNLITYKALNDHLNWFHLFSDLKWGIIIPSIASVLTVLDVSQYVKFGFSLCMVCFYFLLIRSDTFFQQQISQVKDRLFAARGD